VLRVSPDGDGSVREERLLVRLLASDGGDEEVADEIAEAAEPSHASTVEFRLQAHSRARDTSVGGRHVEEA